MNPLQFRGPVHLVQQRQFTYDDGDIKIETRLYEFDDAYFAVTVTLRGQADGSNQAQMNDIAKWAKELHFGQNSKPLFCVNFGNVGLRVSPPNSQAINFLMPA